MTVQWCYVDCGLLRDPPTQNLLLNLVEERMLVPTWHSIRGVQPTGTKLDRHDIGNIVLRLIYLGVDCIVNHVTYC